MLKNDETINQDLFDYHGSTVIRYCGSIVQVPSWKGRRRNFSDSAITNEDTKMLQKARNQRLLYLVQTKKNVMTSFIQFMETVTYRKLGKSTQPNDITNTITAAYITSI